MTDYTAMTIEALETRRLELIDQRSRIVAEIRALTRAHDAAMGRQALAADIQALEARHGVTLGPQGIASQAEVGAPR